MKKKKSNISLKVNKKDVELCYKACLFCYPEFKALEFQCKNEKQLNIFKKLVVEFFIGREAIKKAFNEENNKT